MAEVASVQLVAGACRAVEPGRSIRLLGADVAAHDGWEAVSCERNTSGFELSGWWFYHQPVLLCDVAQPTKHL